MTALTAIQEVRADQLRVGDKMGLYQRNTVTKVIIDDGRVYLGLTVDDGYSLYDCETRQRVTIRARDGYKAEDVTFVATPNLVRADEVKIGDRIYGQGWEVTEATTAQGQTTITSVSNGIPNTAVHRSSTTIRIQDI
jgi:hypothetical protein